MAVMKRAHGPRGNRRQIPFYGCMTRHLRGDAICGGEIPALVAVIQERERRRSHLRTELAAVERQTSVRREAGDVERALDVMREALTDWQGMLRQETGPARRAMQALLKGRLAFTPQERDGERFYTFEGEGTISPVIAGAAGVQRVWWPQRDSNPCLSHDHVFAQSCTRLHAV